jgi:ribosomal protein S18 acetylase RimI-like enzyme
VSQRAGTTDGTSAADIVIRPRTADDFQSLVELDLATARHHAAIDPAAYRVPEREVVARFLERRLRDADRQILVAEADGAVVGAVDIRMVQPPDPGSIVRPVPTADLGISVAERWRGRGIGHALMVAAEGNARRRGAALMVLDMSAANDGAFRFYRGLGYEVSGQLMRRWLAPLA